MPLKPLVAATAAFQESTWKPLFPLLLFQYMTQHNQPIETREMDISAISTYAKNSKTHPDSQIKSLAAAIERFGFTQPIIVNDKNTILAGHGRFEAACQLGLKSVPVRIVSGLSAAEQKAYVIADNKIAEQSIWDEKILNAELADLQDFVADDLLLQLLDRDTFATHQIEQVNIDTIKPHPRNYKSHPADQLDHLKKSITDNGIYRNVIVASDNIILAGHGVVKAAKALGLTSVPILRLPIHSGHINAIKLLTADNEVSHLGEVDDRALTTILKEIMDDADLLGTGYDEKMLANLLFVTRDSSEIESVDHASEWVGMPEYESTDENDKTIVQFENATDKAAFYDLIGAPFNEKKRDSIWFPYKAREKHANKFQEEELWSSLAIPSTSSAKAVQTAATRPSVSLKMALTSPLP